MSNSVKLITDLIIKAVNYQLNHGINLPLPYTLRSDLSKSQLTTYDSYVLIEGDPEITKLKPILKEKKIVEKFIKTV